MKSKGILDAFQHAIDGILHAYRTQRHVRFHFAAIIVVLVAAQLFDFDRQKMVVLFFAISLVLICEMMNTALESAVDLFTDTYHPLAKHAKDIAAGAVLIASLNAFAVGCFLFFDDRRIRGWKGRAGSIFAKPEIADIASILTVTFTILLLLIFIWKVWGQKGTPLHGGVVSGHSALAAFLACVIALTAGSWTAAVIGFVLAFLVSQSRVEGNIHTLRETVLGALLGIIITLIMFRVLPRLMESFIR